VIRHTLGGYQEYSPPNSLAPFCESVWVYRTPSGTPCSTHRVLQDPACNIVLTYLRDSDGHIDHAYAGLSGPKTRPLVARFTGGRETVAIKIKLEWAAAVAGVTATECCDAELDLADVRPPLATALFAILDASPTLQAVASRLTTVLVTSFQPARWRASATTARALDVIRQAEGQLSIDQVAAMVGASPRYLRKIVRRDAGVSPKLYARTLRFLHAVRLADARETMTGAWTRIAADAGFYDQAHLIQETRSLTGFTPQALWTERHRETVPATGYLTADGNRSLRAGRVRAPIATGSRSGR
jgi:AraC-like DNA-binding protein